MSHPTYAVENSSVSELGLLVISVVTNVSGMLNEVFLHVEQKPEVSVSLWLSVDLKPEMLPVAIMLVKRR